MFKVAFSIILLFLLIAGAIQFPYIQTKLVQYITEKYSAKLGYDISIDHISIWWFDSIELEGLEVLDPDYNKMLVVEQLEVDFDLFNVLDKEEHNIDEVIIKGATAYLTKVNLEESEEGVQNFNELIRRIRSMAREGAKPGRQYITIDEVTLTDSRFQYNDPLRDSIPGNRFDYYHFTLDDLNGEFDNLFIVSDTFGVDVSQLTGYDTHTELKVNSLTTKFAVSQSAMEFDDLELLVGQSTIRDSIRFEYTSTADLSDFNSKVLLNGHLQNTIIHTGDLQYFAPALAGLDEFYRVSGDFNGLVKNFNIRNAVVSLGTGTTLRGRIRMTGLPDIDETFIDFDLSNSFVTASDLKPYMKPKTYARLEPLERIGLSAEFIGYPNDFVARGTFYTRFGEITSDINLKLEEDISESQYSGNLRLNAFNLGGYLAQPTFGKVTLDGNIKGKGFTIPTADFVLNGSINEIMLNGYNYKNIKTNARFAQEFFAGELQVNDPNAKLDMTGSIDLRGGLNYFNINAELDTTDLHILNITDKPMIVKSNLNVNASGLEVDDILGVANLGNTYIHYNDNYIQLDSMTVISDKDESDRVVLINSNLFDARVRGQFDLTQLYTNMTTIVKEYQLGLENDSEKIRDYYDRKETEISDFDLNYTVRVADLNPLLEVFVPGMYVSPNTRIEGDITGGYTSILSLETSIDTLMYQNNLFTDNEIQVNVSKIADSTSVLAMIYVGSDNQQLANISTKDLFFEGIWDRTHIDFDFGIEQTKYANSAKLNGAVDFKSDTIELKLDHADIVVLENTWNITPDNLLKLTGKTLLVNDFILSSNDEIIALEGAIAPNDTASLQLNVSNLNLGTINSVLNKELSGTINGYAALNDFYNNLRIESSLNLADLTIDELLIGTINMESHWDNSVKKSVIQSNLNRLGFNIFDVQGTYTPSSESPLDLTATLQGTEVSVFEPFLSSFFTNIRGQLYGEVAISGDFKAPLLDGRGTMVNAGMLINYLNTTYDFEGRFYLTNTKIGFSDIELRDAYDNQALLNGYISHNNFKDMGINIYADMENFQVLNTSAKDNDLFYGNGIATGSVTFSGPLANMSITASARTDKGTRIYIPIGDTESIEQEEYISFVDFNDPETGIISKEIEEIDLRGIKLDFDLDITPDAYCEIIFDIKSGDIIRGRGNGDIKLEIDTKGEFNMFGDFNITEGGYNFTLYNLINKEFEILSGSKITWYGDPYQGLLDINASYNQLASFLPLLEQPLEGEFDYSDVVELRRKYPVNVLLEIDGPLLSPAVDFDIVTGNLPRNILLPNGEVKDLEFEFLKFKNSIDEQELKRQVFSLIILRKFSPLQSFNTGGSITSSVSELFSNQLSYWITQVDENLEIDVDFGKLDEEAFNTFQLRLSYTFLDGRLRVTRDGGFTNQANRADVSSIAGDWTVEYLLTEDGKFKVKMYNRTNYNPINPNQENQNTVTTGVSIIHTQSFDKLKELFRLGREKAKEKRQREEDESDSDLMFDTEASLTKENEEN